LGRVEERNRRYRELAPPLAADVASAAAAGEDGIGCLVSVSCTGYSVPAWDVRLVREMQLSPHVQRLPITEAGCAGGVVALARAADYVRLHRAQRALAVSVELCSLAFHADPEPGNLTSTLIFGDGAAAALLESRREGSRGGLEIVDGLSTLLPGSEDALGFDLNEGGFYPVLKRELVEILPQPTRTAVDKLLGRSALSLPDVGFWLIHPGGTRVLSGLEHCLGLAPRSFRWSWESMRECGNMSSASILDVIRRYLAEPAAPSGWGVVIAFGPGVAIEMLLVRRC
jgi:alkylresorcinol/alkylpyrone synthase